jgi:hypothetical protein
MEIQGAYSDHYTQSLTGKGLHAVTRPGLQDRMLISVANRVTEASKISHRMGEVDVPLYVATARLECLVPHGAIAVFQPEDASCAQAHTHDSRTTGVYIIYVWQDFTFTREMKRLKLKGDWGKQ